MLEVKHGSIYTESGYMIDNMALLVSKDGVFHKYGESAQVERVFHEWVEKYIEVGYRDIADDLVLIKFDRYDSMLSIEDICTLTNWVKECSGTADRLIALMESPSKQFVREKIEQLREIGY